jgi:putative YjhG/YagF family dehydratase
MGTAATSQVVGEALGLSLPHAALSPSGAQIWRDMARRSAVALMNFESRGFTTEKVLSEDALHNAMVVHAAFGGSTNVILHLAAIMHAAGLRRPIAADWARINRQVPRLVDVLPNGPRSFATVQVFLAGGVPEVMLHLRALGLLRTGAMTITGQTLGENLEWWEKSERRGRLREKLRELDGVDPDDVVMSPERGRAAGLTSTVSFLGGNLAPEGALVKSTAIDPSLVGPDGIFLHEGPARVFASEKEAIEVIKSKGPDALKRSEIVVLPGIGPASGMPETYQITSALKYMSKFKGVVLLTDGRFSGVSTGPCIGHISPEAWAGGPLGKLRDGDMIRVRIDTRSLEGSIDFVPPGGTAQSGAAELSSRPLSAKLSRNPAIPDDTRLWAALQSVSGGSWGGCVYDTQRITELLGFGVPSAEGPGA